MLKSRPECRPGTGNDILLLPLAHFVGHIERAQTFRPILMYFMLRMGMKFSLCIELLSFSAYTS